MFLRNVWYVAAWSSEMTDRNPVSRTIIGEPIVIWRKSDGAVVAMEDRCAHRHAPLSLGKIEGDAIRCLYHGLKFGADGACIAVPGSDVVPPNCAVRAFPVAEQSGWIWVWLGDPVAADASAIPHFPSLDESDWLRSEDAIDYAADYQLINDNLTDLSHLDYVHDTTLRVATGGYWSADHPQVTSINDGVLIERWVVNAELAPGGSQRCDHFNSYRYVLPGILLMITRTFPPGTAETCQFGTPGVEPFLERIDQQAVTPIAAGRTRYHYATWVRRSQIPAERLGEMMAVVNAAFAEDKRMIEAQQQIWDQTAPGRPNAFIRQDKAPAMFRRLVARHLASEESMGEPDHGVAVSASAHHADVSEVSREHRTNEAV